MICFENLSAGYDKKTVLHQVSGTFEDGKIHAVIGKNGCGKSTLLKTLAGQLPIYFGKIETNGINSIHISVKERAKMISYMPQSRNVPDMDIRRFVLHGRFAYLDYPRRYSKTDIEIVENVLNHLHISNMQYENLKNISGGQRQKAYLALILTQNTQNMLFDEPMTFLDVDQQYEILKELKSQANLGKCIVVVWHDLVQALKFADTITLMDQGKIIFQGSSQKALELEIIEKNFNIKIEQFIKDNKIYYALDNRNEF